MSEIISVRVSKGVKDQLRVIAGKSRKDIGQLLRPLIEQFANEGMIIRSEEWEISTWIGFDITANQLEWAIRTSKDLPHFFSKLGKFNKRIETKLISIDPKRFTVSFWPKTWPNGIIITKDVSKMSMPDAIKVFLSELDEKVQMEVGDE